MFHYIPAYGSLSCMTHFLVCYADYWYLAIDGSASLKSASCCMAHLEHMAALECPHQLCCQLYSFWHLLLTSHHCTGLVWKHWLPDSPRKKKAIVLGSQSRCLLRKGWMGSWNYECYFGSTVVCFQGHYGQHHVLDGDTSNCDNLLVLWPEQSWRTYLLSNSTSEVCGISSLMANACKPAPMEMHSELTEPDTQ